MTARGWDTYRCGRCGVSWESTTQEQHIARVQLHDELHQAADLLQRLVPELPPDRALAAASQFINQVVYAHARAADVVNLRPAYTLQATHG